MSVYDVSLNSLDGAAGVLQQQAGNVTLLVNVASFCGLTPQYEGLEALYERLSPQGFSILGIPCNQFGAQEPGTPDEIKTFCSTSYGVTFPLSEKVDVNGDDRHPLYQQLTEVADGEGHTGDVRWNFEKFVIGRDGRVIARFSPLIEPANDDLVNTIEKALTESA
ncbi:MAG TPA: glutathione peroxidase [Acidimicrobiia bacterium]|nr:glutathione peroxidase [Acidimicrobiia bacterium]